MTTPDLPAGRTIPDTDDLRLLAELINNDYIPLANAAWNARMSQQEAATRLVEMAELGLPLRLVADGDRQALWQIAQAGPATGAVAPPSDADGLPAPAVPTEGPAAPVAPPAPPAGPAAPVAPPAPPVPVAPPAPPAGPAAPVAPPVPPPAPVPPHEQAIAGAVPLGQPPFGQPPMAPRPDEQPAAEQPASEQPAFEQHPVGGVPSALVEVPASPDLAAAPDPAAAPDAGPVPAAFAAPLGDPDATQVASPEATGEGGRHASDGGNAPADEPRDAVGDGGAQTPARGPAAGDPASTWGVPGTSSWARPDAEPGAGNDVGAAAAALAAASAAAPGTPPVPEAPPAPYEPPRSGQQPAYEPAPSGQQPAYEPAPSGQQPAYQPPAAPYEPPPPYAPEPAPRTWATLPVSGPAGEQLAVTILDVLDPGDAVLTGAGYRMDPGQRAVLVNSSVTNHGQVPYYPVGDLYLVLETGSRQLLGRAAIAVGSHPAYPVGVMPGQTTRGWSVFLIPADTALAGIKWCIRPDLPQTILSWPIDGQ